MKKDRKRSKRELVMINIKRRKKVSALLWVREVLSAHKNKRGATQHDNGSVCYSSADTPATC